MDAIAEVFSEVQESASVSQKQVYALLEQYELNKSVFLRATEQCYLKIVKSMLKAPRKLIEKYEKLTEKLFETGYRQYCVNKEEEGTLRKQKLQKKDIFALFQHFLAFFSGALDSTQLQIRIFSSRIIFQLLKILPAETLVEVIETKVAKQLIIGTLSLMKEKKGNLKQIGIKITSYLQKLMDRDDLTTTQEAKVLRVKSYYNGLVQSGQHLSQNLQSMTQLFLLLNYQTEMMRSMCMDDQDQIRKLALINLEMTENTFPHLIKRIRDKNPEIRATVFKKLIKEQVPLANLNLSDIYKLIYDGLGSRESAVRDACTRYLQLNFCLFKEEDEDKNQNIEDMEVEEKETDDEKRREKARKSSVKRFFTPNKDTALKDIKIKIVNFLKTFEMEKSLYYPELYESLEVLVKDTVRNILDSDGLAGYLKDCFLNQLSLRKKKKHTSISLEGEELFLIRVLCQMVQNPEERKELSPDVVAVVEDCFPNGVDYSSVIDYYAFTQPSLFSLHQVLLTSELLINCDELGRNKLEETLKALVTNMNNTHLLSEIPTDADNEYNDIFYELDPDTVKNNIFAQSYYQSPIVTCSYELLPLIVRILKKVVSDGRVNVQLIQMISEVHEPLAKDADNDSHFDLPSELERIQRIVKEETVKLDQIEKELQNVKKNKTKQKEIYELEKAKEDKQTHIRIWQEKEESTQFKIFDVSMRQLILVQALLTNCKVDPKDQAISNLLQQIIMPGLNSTDDNLVSHSLKALALYVLIDRNYCNDFFSVFQDLLMKNDQCQTCSPQEIISLRSIVDFILLYDLSHKSSDDEEDIDLAFTQELILKYAYQADTLLRTIAIEGISKLLFNGKLQDPHSTICLLMVIWFDTKICQKEGFKAVQILSTLFKTFTASNYQNLCVFEKALELFSQLIVTLDKKGIVFNDEYVIFDHLNEKFTSKALRVGINLMSYEYHKSTETLRNAPNNEFPPQERFFLYLAYKCSKDRRFLSLFDKVSQFFDFYNHCSDDQLLIMLQFVKDAIENCSANKQLHLLEKLIKDKIRVQHSKEKQDEDLANLGEKKDEMMVDEDKLFVIDARQKKVCERIIEQIENNQSEMELIVKNLLDSKILVQDTVEQKEKRARFNEDEEDEMIEEDIEEVQEDQRQSAPTRGGKRKAMQSNDEENDPEIQVEEILEVKQDAKSLPKSSKGVSRRDKKAKEVDPEEQDEEQEDDEVIEKRTSSRRTQKSAPQTAASKKINKKVISKEEDEDQSDDEIIQEEEYKQDEIAEPKQKKGLHLNESDEDDIVPKRTQGKAKTNNQNKGRKIQSSELSEKDETKNSKHSEEQATKNVKGKSGGQATKGKTRAQMPQSEEEDEEEIAPQRMTRRQKLEKEIAVKMPVSSARRGTRN